MKANEIRIGNYVDCVNKRHNEKYIEIESVTCEKINVEFREYSLSDCKPIPLTEDWLLKFGFMTNGNYWTNLVIDLDYITQEDYFEYEIQFPFLDWVKRDLKYVHQLQNLYFALTGEELTLT